MHFSEMVFADDLNAYAEVDKNTSNTEALEQARTCQTSLHAWGRANQVSFDASKESFHVLSQHEPEGDDFKLLGVLFDCQLRMEGAVKELVQEAARRRAVAEHAAALRNLRLDLVPGELRRPRGHLAIALGALGTLRRNALRMRRLGGHVVE